jgi:8-oxo-dGTP pyrophosphatase MutT (NUDIX family)
MRNLQDLKNYIESLSNSPAHYKVAVGSLIFTNNNKVILQERGFKARDSAGLLEGIGGELDEGETDLHLALKREVQEEIGQVGIEIEDLLTVLILPGKSDNNTWVVPIYLCRLISGKPLNMEPEKISDIKMMNLMDITEDRLSPYKSKTMRV